MSNSLITALPVFVSRPTVPHARADVLARIRALIGALHESARSVQSSTGITNAQLFLLRQMATAEELSINELAALARTQQSTVSTVVARLVRRGLVRRRRSAEDGRRVAASLTPAGRKLLRSAPKPATDRLINALDALGQQESRALGVGLRALTERMGLSARAPGMLFEEGIIPPAKRRRSRSV